MHRVVSIVGFGNIGKYISGLLLAHPEHPLVINIMDVDWKVFGAILDLEHAAELFPQHHIVYNSQELFNQSDFIFHCAGATVPRGKSRLLTSSETIEITEAAFKGFQPEKTPKIIVIANPVEIIAFVTQRISGLPPTHVVGTGTYLDSIRMNHIVKKANDTVNDVKAILLGEHGISAFLSEHWSTVDGKSFSSVFSKETVEEMMNAVKASAEEIKQTQAATIYGVSFCAVKIFEAFLREQTTQLPVSTYLPGDLRLSLGNEDLYLSLYSNLNAAGVYPVEEYSPNAEERSMLQKSIDMIKPCIPQKYC